MAVINIRDIDDTTAQRFRAAAGARTMTASEYLRALVRLHDAVRARADAGDASAETDLTTLGLQSVVT